MEYLNEADTKEKILRPLLLKSIRRSCLNENTLKLFESLSFSEKLETAQWIKTNLASISMPGKTKKVALEKISKEEFEDPTGPMVCYFTLNSCPQNLWITFSFRSPYF